METFKLRDMSFIYPECSSFSLKNIDLEIKKGEFLLICGASGSGKSTLLRHLKPSIAPFGTKSGEILFNGKNIDRLDIKTQAEKIAYVMQSPEHQTVCDKVKYELSFGLESLGKDSETIRRKTAETAEFFGLEGLFEKDVASLSGGQKQLLCLAAAMVSDPEVIVLDEPTSQLDPIAASEFFASLAKINRELGTTVIISEHRLEDVFALADRVVVMEDGGILFCGTPAETGIFLKENDYAMFAAMPAAMQIWSSLESSEKAPVTVNEGKNFVNAYVKKNGAKPFEAKKLPDIFGEETVCARELRFRYEKDSPDVLKDLDISVRKGELFCILGGNGCGKTTALKVLGGIKKPYSGDISIKGRTGYLPQDPETVFIKNTVYDDLYMLLKENSVKKEEAEKEIEKIASLCKITHILDRHPYDLSGGEMQRAALAKILLLSPDILLLDEPTKGLDARLKECLADILINLKRAGVCIIIVSHDVEFCAKYADTCGLFFNGSLAAVSDPTEFFSGNSFYTTAANRIARDTEPRAVTSDDVITLLGGKTKEKKPETGPDILYEKREIKLPETRKKLPLWRKLCAVASSAAALGIFIYTSKTGFLSQFVKPDGMTQLGGKRLLLYILITALLGLTAVFAGRRSAPQFTVQTPEDKRKLSKRTLVAVVLILLAIPLTLFVGISYIGHKQYYITALLVLTECMLPFFMIFEGKKPRARELVITASLCALAVAGRAVFFMLPEFKPVMAITIIAGVAFGGETGFFTGALSMLVSNMLFAQGPWTPFQMFAMGITGFLAGVLYKKGVLLRSAGSLAVFGAICAIVIYGGIMNPTSLLMWGSETINLKLILGYYITGFPLDAIHAASTALFLWFGAEPLIEKLDRLKVKYGLV